MPPGQHLYHPVVSESQEQRQSNASHVADAYLPVNREARLHFTEQLGFATTEDFRFERVFGLDSYDFFEQFGDQADAIWARYHDFVRPDAIAQVGGYAVFAQDDPRMMAPQEDWVLLLQLDSHATDDGVEVLWGDAGTGSFHIRRQDLLDRDFSRVLYSWDSH